MKAILEAAGSGLEHVVKANIYLANMQRDFVAMNEVYAEVCSCHLFDAKALLILNSKFYPKNPSARTCIGVTALPLGADVEIECIAELQK